MAPHNKETADSWQNEFDAAITVIARNFTVVYLNEKSIAVHAKWGGAELIGNDVRPCHQEHSIRIIEHILETGEPNTYTIEKQGIRKLIHQAPWFKNGLIIGAVEISIELPTEMPHYIRT